MSASPCTVCRLQYVFDFCAVWFRWMSGALPENQSQSTLGHRVLHVHPEDIKGDSLVSLTDRLSAHCCWFLGCACSVQVQCQSQFLLIQRRPAPLCPWCASLVTSSVTRTSLFTLQTPDIQKPTIVCNPSEVSRMQSPYMMMCFWKADLIRQSLCSASSPRVPLCLRVTPELPTGAWGL